MTVSNWQVRRATLDDLVALRRLWQRAGLPAALEKRIREFQVVETATGDLLGAVGFEILPLDGLIHSEAYQQPELADELRPRLWERVQSLARSHRLLRLWIENPSSVFWLEKGFQAANSALIAKLPASCREKEGQRWHALQIREENEASLSVEQEFVLFQNAQQQERNRMARQTRLLRAIAALMVAVLLGLMAWAAWVLLVHFHRAAPFR
jgi:N-acetylglutamate synthase-like GNAT family acetyltransferase